MAAHDSLLVSKTAMRSVLQQLGAGRVWAYACAAAADLFGCGFAHSLLPFYSAVTDTDTLRIDAFLHTLQPRLWDAPQPWLCALVCEHLSKDEPALRSLMAANKAACMAVLRALSSGGQHKPQLRIQVLFVLVPLISMMHVETVLNLSVCSSPWQCVRVLFCVAFSSDASLHIALIRRCTAYIRSVD
jgi:hypothetical protein